MGIDHVDRMFGKPAEQPKCVRCAGGGWLRYEVPHGQQPGWVECRECGNPLSAPRPASRHPNDPSLGSHVQWQEYMKSVGSGASVVHSAESIREMLRIGGIPTAIGDDKTMTTYTITNGGLGYTKAAS